MTRNLLQRALRISFRSGVVLSLAALPVCTVHAQNAPVNARMEHGRYLAVAGDCLACHTATDGKPFAGGLDLKTPFGIITTSNITSDKETGIGNWTFEQFDNAVRHGKGPNGHLYPAMPYTAYSQITDADIADLWEYIRTLPPVSHKVESNKLPFPYNIRTLLVFWNFLFFKDAAFVPDSSKSDEINRGAYLAQSLGHCGTCHTPKNALGGDTKDTFQGASLQGWFAPDLTNNAHTGLGQWTADDIVTYLRSGTNRYTAASGPMTEAIVNSTQHLTDADLKAIAAYFKALPPRTVSPPQPLAASNAQVTAGQRDFMVECSACHRSSGAGISNMIPDLRNNPAVNASNPDSLLNIVLKGTEGPATHANPTGAAMPGFGWKLQDEQIANVLTYIRNSWGNAAPALSAADVSKARTAISAQPAVPR